MGCLLYLLFFCVMSLPSIYHERELSAHFLPFGSRRWQRVKIGGSHDSGSGMEGKNSWAKDVKCMMASKKGGEDQQIWVDKVCTIAIVGHRRESRSLDWAQ